MIKIWLEASIKAHDFVNSEFWESKVKDIREIYIPASETFVYEENETIKGFFSLYKNTLTAIFISPPYQGAGIGMALMKKAKEIRSKLELTVYKQNYKSVEFYKKCGFVAEREQIDEQTGHPELLMTFSS